MYELISIEQDYAIYRSPETKAFTLSCTPEQETVSVTTVVAKNWEVFSLIFGFIIGYV